MNLAKLPWVWWSPGEPDDDLFGFITKKERDASGRGEPGPFRRIVRNLRERPITFEERIQKAYLSGNLKQLLEE